MRKTTRTILYYLIDGVTLFTHVLLSGVTLTTIIQLFAPQPHFPSLSEVIVNGILGYTALTIGILLLGLILNKSQPNNPTYILAISKGHSMLPHLPGGKSMVFAYKTDTYSIGDVVTFTDPTTDTTIHHRIIDTTDDGGFILKGDNNPFKDGKIYPDDIEYKTLAIGSFIPFFPIDSLSRIETLLLPVYKVVHAKKTND